MSFEVISGFQIDLFNILVFFFFLIPSVGVYLLYNVVLVSQVQQSVSVFFDFLHLFFDFLPFRRRALNRVPCSNQQVLISYLFYTQYQQCIYLPIYPTHFTNSLIEGSYFQISPFPCLQNRDHSSPFRAILIYAVGQFSCSVMTL